MTLDDWLLVVLMVLWASTVILFAVGWYRNAQQRDTLSPAQRKSLEYTRKLLGNYHAAHQSSPLTGVEIEEVLILCRAELDKVLEE